MGSRISLRSKTHVKKVSTCVRRCASCGLQFSCPRSKTKKSESIRFCSEMCRRSKERFRDPSGGTRHRQPASYGINNHKKSSSSITPETRIGVGDEPTASAPSKVPHDDAVVDPTSGRQESVESKARLTEPIAPESQGASSLSTSSLPPVVVASTNERTLTPIIRDENRRLFDGGECIGGLWPIPTIRVLDATAPLENGVVPTGIVDRPSGCERQQIDPAKIAQSANFSSHDRVIPPSETDLEFLISEPIGTKTIDTISSASSPSSSAYSWSSLYSDPSSSAPPSPSGAPRRRCRQRECVLWRCTTATHVGGRDEQQDVARIATMRSSDDPRDEVLFAVVCDGHGSGPVPNGATAAGLTINAIFGMPKEAVIDGFKLDASSPVGLSRFFAAAAERAHRQISSLSWSSDRFSGDPGTTMCAAAVPRCAKVATVVVSNVGDSQALLLSAQNEIKFFTTPHKPATDETPDIRRDNTKVFDNGYIGESSGGMTGGLAMTRAIGHTYFAVECGILPRPTAYRATLKTDDALVIASDGFWGYYSQSPETWNELVDYVDRLDVETAVSNSVVKMGHRADNTTAIMARFVVVPMTEGSS